MEPVEKFYHERAERSKAYRSNVELAKQSQSWLENSMRAKYVYNFDWLGRPIIQYPNDIVALQEIIWNVKPDLIIETGIAHGGSLIFNASMLAMLDMVDAIEASTLIDPKISNRKVLGIDIDIRDHNLDAIESHPMFSRIQMIEGSSISPGIVSQVKNIAKSYRRILVCLDSNHTHDHVLAELEAYAQLTSTDSYCVVFDTFIEDVSEDLFPNRPWGKGDNPKTAVRKYLETHSEFEIDNSIQDKLLITVATDGFLKRLR